MTKDTITVADLSTPQGYRRMTASRSDVDLTRRSLLLSPLHHASWAIIELLARPCFYDQAWITAEPHQLGLHLDPAGDLPELWLAPDLAVTERPDPSTVGTTIGALLAPVADVVARCSRIHHRAVTIIAAESAIGGLFRTARTAGHPDERDWLDTTSAALASALGARDTTDRLHLRPDAGPDVIAPARSLCCVLHATLSCHGCPGCPKTGNRAERARGITEWLAAMDDEQFLDTTGRTKQPAMPPTEIMSVSITRAE